MKTKIKCFPSKVLRTATKEISPVEDIPQYTETFTQIGSRMLEILRDRGGIGLSANQVGLDLRMCVVELRSSECMIMLNPEVVSVSEEKEKQYEACLSFPGAKVLVERPKYCTVTYYDVDGEKQLIDATGLLARCLQHEIDHLEGVTMLERTNSYYADKARRDVKRYKRGVK